MKPESVATPLRRVGADRVAARVPARIAQGTLAVLIALTAACSREPAPVPGTPADAELVKQLQGAWCVSDDGGKTCWGYDRFDGQTVHACGRLPEDGQAFTAVASFAVSGQTACYTVIDSDRQDTYPPGHQFCATVLEINDRFQRYRMDGADFSTYRVPLAAVVCPHVT